MKKENISKNLGVSVSGAELENRVSEISDEEMNGVVGGLFTCSYANSNLFISSIQTSSSSSQTSGICGSAASPSISTASPSISTKIQA